MTGWFDGPLLAFDTETTSADPLTARLVSAAVILDIPGKEPQTSDWLIDPGCEIPLDATAVHGISTEHAAKYGRKPVEVIPEILIAIYSGPPLVIMNATFDLTILDRELRRHDIGPVPGLGTVPPVIDPMVLDRLLDPYRPGRRTLTAIAASYGVAIKGAHQAAGDCLASLRLARAIIAKYPALHTPGTALSLERLQEVQARAQARWAANYQEFRRTDEPGFTCLGDWPLIPFMPETSPENGTGMIGHA